MAILHKNEDTEMVRAILVVAGAVLWAGAEAHAQGRPLFVAIPNGDTVVVLSTATPERDQGLRLLRRPAGATTWDTLTSQPVMGAQSPPESVEMLGADYEAVAKTLQAETDLEVYRRLRRNGDPTGDVLAVTNRAVAYSLGRLVIDTGAQSGARYDYRLQVVNASGEVLQEQTQSVSVVTTPPPSPTALSAEQKNNTYVQLRWDYPEWKGDVSDVVIAFSVYRRSEGGAWQKVNKTPVLRLNTGSFVFDDSEVFPGGKYEYSVESLDMAGRVSAKSAPVAVSVRDTEAPAVPPAPLVRSAEGGAVLTWNIAFEPDAAGYNIWRAERLQGDRVKLNKTLVPVDSLTWSDFDPAAPAVRYYGVSVVDASGNESPVSVMAQAIASDTTAPRRPSSLTVKKAPQGARLSWAANTERDLAGYYVWRRVPGREANAVILHNGALTEPAYTDTTAAGFDDGTPFEYFVQALDAERNASAMSDTVRFEIPDVTPPDPVSGLSHRRNDFGETVLVWTPSPSRDADSARVAQIVGGKKKNIATVPAGRSAVVIGDIPAGEYIFEVAVADKKNNISKPVSYTVSLRDESVPLPPIGLRSAVSKKNNAVVVEWKKAPEKDVVGYNIYVSPIPTGSYKKVNSKPVGVEKYEIQGSLRGGYVRVTSVDASGNESDYSSYSPIP